MAEDKNTRSEALRKSKMSYLEEHKNTMEASPYYWSGIILNGDPGTIQIDDSGTSTIFKICLGIFVFILIGIGVWKRMLIK